MNYYTSDNNYTIQKLAKDVFRQVNNGVDPLNALLKEAKGNNLTPAVITSAVHYLNNELYLDHYNRGSQGMPKTLNVQDVLDQLAITNEKTASVDIGDLSELKPSVTYEPYEDPMIKKRQRELLSAQLKKESMESDVEKRNVETTASQLGIKIGAAKRDLLDETVIALTRNEITPEEIYVLMKSAVDTDVSETLQSALIKTKSKIDETKLAKIAEELQDPDVNTESPIFRSINNLMCKKANFNELFDRMSSIEIADLRREGIRKLLNAHMGYHF